MLCHGFNKGLVINFLNNYLKKSKYRFWLPLQKFCLSYQTYLRSVPRIRCRTRLYTGIIFARTNNSPRSWMIGMSFSGCHFSQIYQKGLFMYNRCAKVVRTEQITTYDSSGTLCCVRRLFE